jgi:2-polyprenyl-6-methoxyphenol hydroxylase-like FAD-dependent oxidoreductase
VLVVGAGPVGLYSALELVNRGLKVQIIDAEWRPAAHAYALALHPQSLELLADLGFAQPIIEHGYRVDRVTFFDGEIQKAQIDLNALPGRFPFVVVMPQSNLESAFAQWLKERGVKVQWNHRVSELTTSGDRGAATIDKWDKETMGYATSTTEWVIAKSFKLHYDMVVGADGHRSTMRRMLDIPFESVGRPEQFAVFEFETDADLGHELRVVLKDGLASVLWPLPGGRCRWSFQLPPDEEVDAERPKSRLAVQIGERVYPHLTTDYLRRMIAERAPWFRGSIRDVNWSLIVRFERRLASRFGQGRTWLVGDAAHLAGPAAVQSMNIGLREAHEVALRIAKVLRDGASPTTLTEYSEERLREWQWLLRMGGGLAPTSEADRWVAAHAEAIQSCIPSSGPELRELARQIGLA